MYYDYCVLFSMEIRSNLVVENAGFCLLDVYMEKSTRYD